MIKTHPNSKKITIFRKASALANAQGPEIDEYYSSSRQPLGSYWDKESSQKIGNGLTLAEENLLLPIHLNILPTDSGFRKAVNEFYQEISTPVPFGTGAILEVGLEESNDKPLSKDNMPIDVSDYIRYRHALNHPWVAESKEAGLGNQLKSYYIFDKTSTDKKNTGKRQEEDAATAIYLKVKNDKEHVKHMLLLLGTDPRGFEGVNADELMVEKLKEYSVKEAKRFTSVYEAGNLELRYTLQAMIDVKVLKQLGAKLFDTETDKLIGNNAEEALDWFEDTDNSDAVIALKSRLQVALLESPKVASKRTVV